MNYGIVRVDCSKRDIGWQVSQSEISPQDVIEVIFTLRCGEVHQRYTKSTKVRKWLNKTLGASFKAVFTLEGENPVSSTKCLSIDNGLVILTNDNRWIEVSVSEWGSIFG